jgi:hypothetical protein
MDLRQTENMIKLQNHFIEFSINLMELTRKEMRTCLIEFPDFLKTIHIKKNFIKNGMLIGLKRIRTI